MGEVRSNALRNSKISSFNDYDIFVLAGQLLNRYSPGMNLFKVIRSGLKFKSAYYYLSKSITIVPSSDHKLGIPETMNCL